MSDDMKNPYPEFDSVVNKLCNMVNIWEKVLIDEKDAQDRLKKIELMSEEEKEEAIYELENRPAGGIHFACMEAIRTLGVEDDVYAVAKLTIAIRHVARQQISA